MPINQYQHIQHKYTRINLHYFDRIFSLQAINSPGAETEKSAWEALLPAVEQLKDFYEFSLELGEFYLAAAYFFLTAWFFCAGDTSPPNNNY